MLHFIRLTGHKTGRSVIVQVSQVQAVFSDDTDATVTVVLLPSAAKMHVRESADDVLHEIIATGPALASDPVVVERRLNRLEDIVDQIAPTVI